MAPSLASLPTQRLRRIVVEGEAVQIASPPLEGKYFLMILLVESFLVLVLVDHDGEQMHAVLFDRKILLVHSTEVVLRNHTLLVHQEVRCLDGA